MTAIVLPAVAVLSAAMAAPGERQFRLGVTPFPYDMTLEALADASRFVRDNTDLIVAHLEGVPWQEALTGEPVHPNLMGDWARYREGKPEDMPLYLAVSPLNLGRADLAAYRGEREGLPVPEALAGKPFDDPLVIKAYTDYVRRAVEYFRPSYLAIGVETNELFHNARPKWEGYVRLHQAVREAIKRDHPNLPVFATFTLHNMRNPGWADHEEMLAAWKDLMPYNDVVAISCYPFMGQLSGQVTESLAWVTQEFAPFGKAFAIAEMGEIAEPLSLTQPAVTIPGDPETQRRVLEEVLAWAQAERVEFVVWYVSRDYDALWEKLKATSPEWFKVWKDCGLLDGEGRPRPAFQVWRESYLLPYRR